MKFLVFFVIAHGSIVDYNFINSVGQVVLDTSGNQNHAVLGNNLLKSSSDPILTDRGAYFTSTTYISLPPNSLLPLTSLSIGNFYGVIFIHILSSGTILTISLSQNVKLKLQHQSSTISFYQYTLLSSSVSRPLTLNSWQAIHIGYNFLAIGGCISTSHTIKVSSEISSLSGLPLSSSSTYTVQLGSFSGLSGFEGFISEFHLYTASECATAYATHASATFPSSYSTPLTSGAGDSCSCSGYSCTGSPLTCIQCDSACDLYCSPASTCIDIVEICKPYAIVNGICDTSVLYINNCKTQQSSFVCTICDTGYYFVSSQNCQICDSSCAGCDGNTALNCLSCKDSLATLNPDKSCTCDLGTDPVTGACLGCLPECGTCNSISTCLTCKDLNAQLNSYSLCECPANFYDDPNTSTLDCFNCHTSCASCSGPSSSNCILCTDPNAFSASGTCTCNQFFYYNSLTNACESCHSDCASCNSGLINGCTQCLHPNSELLNSPGQCTCKSGFVEMNSSPLMCSACHLTCDSCFGTADYHCSSCRDPEAALVNWQCLCNSGFYYDGNWQCIACVVDCGDCAGAGNSMCDSCNDANAELQSVPGICQCVDGFVAIGQNPLVCSACYSDCATCTGTTINDCLSCISSYSILVNGKCGCAPGYMEIGQNPLVCSACYIDCATCIGLNINDCSSCLVVNSILVNGLCTCGTGYIQTGQNPLICSKCHIDCLTCTGLTINDCSSCKAFNSIFKNGLCECAAGYVKVGLNPFSCSPCHINCATCTGPTINDCSSCVAANSISNNGLCECGAGYLQTGQNPLICSACFKDCVACLGLTINDCTSCKGPNTILTNSVCECAQGYSKINSNPLMCLSCHQNCLTCKGLNKNDCIICKSESNILINSICKCKPGFATISSDPLVCSACYETCKTCSGTEKKDCLNCKDPYAILNNGECTCLNGFFYSNETNSCEKCKDGCENCKSLETCEFCVPDHFIKDSSCYKCHSSCYSCSGNSKFDCLTCKNSSIIPSKIPGNCECDQGEYINTINPLECQACTDSCKICNYLKCLECNQGYSIQDSECFRNELNLKLEALSNNSILFSFSESLSKSLKNTDIKSKVGDKPLGFSLYKKNSSAYQVNLNNPEYFSERQKITFSVVGQITSISNSLLKKTQFFCYIEKPVFFEVTNPYILEVSIDIILSVSIFSAISSIFLRSKNGSVWISLNTIQMLSYVPLFNIKIPDILTFFLLGIRPVSVLPNPFEILGKFSCTTPAIPIKFQEYGYTCKHFILNSGEILFFFLIGLCFFLVFFISYSITCRRCRLLKQFFKKKLKTYKYSFFFRFWIQSYTDIVLITAISLNFVSAATKYDEADSTLAIFSGIFLAATPVVFIIFYKTNSDIIAKQDKVFRKKFSPLFKDFIQTGAYCYFYSLFFCLRLIFVAALYCLQNFPVWQIGIGCCIQVASVWFMAKFKVLREKWNYRLYLFEETLIFAVFFMVGLFLFDFSRQVVEKICYGIIAVVVFGVMVGITSTICGIISDIKKKCIKRKRRVNSSVVIKINNQENIEIQEKSINDKGQINFNKCISITPAGSFPELEKKTTGVVFTNFKKIKRVQSFIHERIIKN